MSGTECTFQRVLFEVGQQEVIVKCDGPSVVTDAGLLPIAELDRRLGLLAEAASRLPDPRDQRQVLHSVEHILRQQVFQILAGYPDGNDSQLLRDDPLMKTIVGVDPRDEDQSLASGSTLNRFQHAYTRRESNRPLEEREVLQEVRQANIQRITGLNEFLIDAFVRTRLTRPERVIIDLDPTDDPAHGKQQLTLWHGYYDQNQYFPMMIFEGQTGFPLGAWLRPGTVHASCGAADMLRQIVDRLRQHWPGIEIQVRGDQGIACPEMYDYCESAGLQYALGYSTNEVLKRRSNELELRENARWLWWTTGQRHFQLFHMFEDYQAESWSRPRRVLTKVEITRTGEFNQRFVVTNMPGLAQEIYRGFYIQRGRVPEQPIGEMKNGLRLDRLSSSRFLANAHKLLVHTLAYMLYVVFREANARTSELQTMQVGQAQMRLFKAGAHVTVSHRRIVFEVARHWPGRDLFLSAIDAVKEHVARLHQCWTELNLFIRNRVPRSAHVPRISFAPRIALTPLALE